MVALKERKNMDYKAEVLEKISFGERTYISGETGEVKSMDLLIVVNNTYICPNINMGKEINFYPLYVGADDKLHTLAFPLFNRFHKDSRTSIIQFIGILPRVLNNTNLKISYIEVL